MISVKLSTTIAKGCISLKCVKLIVLFRIVRKSDLGQIPTVSSQNLLHYTYLLETLVSIRKKQVTSIFTSFSWFILSIFSIVRLPLSSKLPEWKPKLNIIVCYSIMALNTIDISSRLAWIFAFIEEELKYGVFTLCWCPSLTRT